MIYQEYFINTNCPVIGLEQPVLQAYLLNPPIAQGKLRPAVIICPGGGYSRRSVREGEPVAMRFLSQGINAVVLQYSIVPNRFPTALTQLAESIRFIRSHAEEWSIDTNQIFLNGFSAGGHLAACLGTMWNQEWLQKIMGSSPSEYQPNGMILCYPVITTGPFTHQESCEHLMGSQPDETLLQHLSLENQVSSNTPPTFLWHTQQDTSVPVENSLLFSIALRQHKIPFELHIYERGIHGLALADEVTMRTPEQWEPNCQDWIDKAISWLKRQII